MLQSQLIAGQPRENKLPMKRFTSTFMILSFLLRGRRSPAASRNRHVGTRWLSLDSLQLWLVLPCSGRSGLRRPRFSIRNRTSQFQVEGTKTFTPGTTLLVRDTSSSDFVVFFAFDTDAAAGNECDVIANVPRDCRCSGQRRRRKPCRHQRRCREVGDRCVHRSERRERHRSWTVRIAHRSRLVPGVRRGGLAKRRGHDPLAVISLGEVSVSK